ncbi:MAG: hypothetical protein HOW73_27320 [Polyangiaceae bacterium]|nr:hypothetical protein [Polyangiaceae bacterium]
MNRTLIPPAFAKIVKVATPLLLVGCAHGVSYPVDVSWSEADQFYADAARAANELRLPATTEGSESGDTSLSFGNAVSVSSSGTVESSTSVELGVVLMSDGSVEIAAPEGTIRYHRTLAQGVVATLEPRPNPEATLAQREASLRALSDEIVRRAYPAE